MNRRVMIFVGGAIGLMIIAIIALSLVFTPEDSNPAFAVAVDFANAVGKGDDATAQDLMGDALQAYVVENCPNGSASACVDDYTPPEWGDMLSAVYRRSRPLGRDWEVLLVATYEEEQGFSGVCLYTYLQEVAEDDWRVTAWSGFVSCDGDASGIEGLSQDDAPNHAP